MISIKSQSIVRLFNAVAEPIARMSETRANFRAGLTLDFVISVVLLALGMRAMIGHPETALWIIFSGLLLFTLIEYCFHRWLFHGQVPLMGPGHQKHHESPLGFDSLPFFLPPIALLVLMALFTVFMPLRYALLLTGGLAVGYAIYGLSHRIIHITRFRYPLFKRWAAIHYMHHHHPDKNFGVTTPLWDIILGTRYIPRRFRDEFSISKN